MTPIGVRTPRACRSMPALAAAGSVDNPPAGLIDPDQFETIRHSPHLPPRRRRPAGAAHCAGSAGGDAGRFLGVRRYVQTQYFIGPDEKRGDLPGLPEQILGRGLEQGRASSSIQVADLPPRPCQPGGKPRPAHGSPEEARPVALRAGTNGRTLHRRAGGRYPAPTASATPASPGSSASPGVSPGVTGIVVVADRHPVRTATPRPDPRLADDGQAPSPAGSGLPQQRNAELAVPVGQRLFGIGGYLDHAPELAVDTLTVTLGADLRGLASFCASARTWSSGSNAPTQTPVILPCVLALNGLGWR